MNKQEVFEILTDGWIKDYLCNVTGQEVTKVEEVTFLPLDDETGVIKDYYTEDYSFRFYFINGVVQLREDIKRVDINDLDELDRVINKQFMENFQI